MSTTYRAALISHTHWDREWYAPFQAFRMRLVGLMDELIEKMEDDPRYRFFHLDGQTILFEDYLEIRPEMEARLRALCQAGRIISGPMYVSPDESLPGAETHVRNFLLGLRQAAAWGPVLESGYVIDIFGHISQWPQMLRGFGIDNAVMMRGVNDSTCGAEFIWRSPDGSDVLAIRLSNTVSYSDFWYRVRRADEGKLLDLDAALLRLKELVDWQRTRHSTGELLLMDGVDHVEIQPDVPDLIERYNARYAAEGEIVHEALPVYLERLRAAVDRKQLITLTGELRSPNQHSPLGQVFFGYHCSHPELKAANDRCEALLQYWAEPLLAAGYLLTGKHDHAFLWHAWKQLLQNQPHDSICGCSVDQAHKDMLFRYDQCRLLAERIIENESRRLAARQAAPCAAAGALAVHLINGAGAPVNATTLVEIPLPQPRPEHFDLVAPDGRTIPWQLVAERKPAPEYEFGWGQIPRFPVKARITIAAPLAVPACGMAAYHVVPRSAPAPSAATLATTPAGLANEIIEFSVESDGGLTLRDKRSGKLYRGLLRFEDCGDVGDGWTYRAPAADERILSGPVRVTRLSEGPLYAALRLETTMSIPAAAAPDRRARGAERVDLRLSTTVAILQGDPALHVETLVDNPARDHKLRVLFPTDIAAQTWSSDSPFDLTERPIAVQLTPGWDEPAQEIWWQQSLCTVSSGQDGLAIIAPECKESACVDDARRTLALSLFRAFGQTVGTAGEDGPQRLGCSVFRYQIVPYQGSPASAGLLNRSAAMRAGLRAVVLPPHSGDLPASQGLIRLAPSSLVLTTLKKREEGDGLIVRFFNPSSEPLQAVVTFPPGLAAAYRANLREQNGEALPVDAANAVRLAVRGKEIVTLALQPG